LRAVLVPVHNAMSAPVDRVRVLSVIVALVIHGAVVNVTSHGLKEERGVEQATGEKRGRGAEPMTE
jgi:hypothetical protein